MSKQSQTGNEVFVPRAPATKLDFIPNGDEKFEDMCRDLVAEEPGIGDCYLYSRKRQKQHGIDVYAEHLHGGSITVASCKCYKTIRKGAIKTFSTDFLKHWDTVWKTKKVRRFILCVACDLNAQERRAEIALEVLRFKPYKIKYEVWTQSRLTQFLRKHPDIREVYFKHLYEISVGANAAAEIAAHTTAASPFLSVSEIGQIAELQRMLSLSVDTNLDRLKNALQSGDYKNVRTELAAIVSSETTWRSLDRSVQARVVRMQASLAMQAEDMVAAASLLDRAEGLAPNEERRTRAVLIARTDTADAALTVLGRASTQDGALLRAALELEAGRPTQARTFLDTDPLIIERDAEWYRLSACTAYVLGDRELAAAHCDQAEALGPDNVAVLDTTGVLRYAFTLAPAANFKLTDGLDPTQVDFALLDDASQTQALIALGHFDRLASNELGPLQKERVAMWRLACLTLMPQRQEQLKSDCSALIAGRDPVGAAVMWALARDLPFDSDHAEKQLRARLDRRAAPFDALQALTMIWMVRGDKDRALTLLKRYSPQFKSPTEVPRIAAIADRLAKRRNPRKPVLDPTPYEKLLRLGRSKWSARRARMIEAYLSEGITGANVVMVGSLILASHSAWSSIVPLVERLLREVGNAEAVRLSAYARYNCADFSGALAVLNAYSDRFPGKQLPLDLIRIQASAAAAEGRFPEALSLAQALAKSTGRPADQMLYSQLAVRSGNIKEAIPFLRGLSQSGSVPPEKLVAFIPSVSTVDPALARVLLAQATQAGINLETGGVLLDWHYRLGMDREAHTLFQRLVSLQQKGKRGPIKRVPLTQIRKFLEQRQKLFASLEESLRKAVAPVHAIAGALNANLAEIWDQAFKTDGEALLIRAANRAEVMRFDPLPETLALDITALLTIEQLGLLARLLESPLKIELPASLMEVLSELEQTVPSRQPTRILVLQRIIDFQAAGNLKTYAPGTQLAEKVLRVVHEAKVSGEAGDEEKGTGEKLPSMPLPGVGHELVRANHLTPEAFTLMQGTLAGWAGQSSSNAESSSALVFEDNTIESIFHADIEHVTAQRWQLWGETDYLQRISAEIAASREAQALADRLKLLRETLARAIVLGQVTVLAVSAAKSKLMVEAPHSYIRPLSELLNMEFAPGRWIWMDDRYATSYGGANQTPIVSTFEVLAVLEQLEIISSASRYEYLLKLRSAGAQYLPLSVKEVMHWLLQAKVQEGGVLETPALRTLRRSFHLFSALLKDLRIQASPDDNGREPELKGVAEALFLLKEVLADVWTRDDDPVEAKVARSQWLWDAMRLEVPLQVGSDALTRSQVLWLQVVCQLVLLGASFYWIEPKGMQEALFEWLVGRVPGLDGKSDPELFSLVVKTVREAFTLSPTEAAQAKNEEKLEPNRARAMLAMLVQNLPPELRDAAYADKDFATHLGAQMRTFTTIGGLEVDPNDFFGAVESADAGASPTIKTLQGEEFVVSAQLPRILLEGKSAIELEAPEFRLLASEVERRIEFLSSVEGNLEADERLNASLLQELANEPSPWRRLLSWAERRDKRQVGRFRQIWTMVHAQQSVKVQELLPAEPDAYVEYLGLQVREGAVMWEESAKTAIRRFGFIDALGRWAGIPVRLPEEFVLQFQALGDEAKDSVRKWARRPTATAQACLRVVEVSVRGGDADSIQDEMLTRVFEAWPELGPGYLSILQWAARIFKRSSQWRGAMPAVRLAATWAHAHQLLALLSDCGMALADIPGCFDPLTHEGVADAIVLEKSLEEDAAAPSRLNSRILLATIISASVAGCQRDLLVALKLKIAEHLSNPIGEIYQPSVELFQDRTQAKDSVGTYFTLPWDPSLSVQLEIAGLGLGSPVSRDALRESSFELLEQYPADPISWLQLYSVGPQWLPTAARQRLESALLKVQLPDDDAETRRRLLFGLSNVLPFVGAEAQRELLAKGMPWITDMARRHRSLMLSADFGTEIAQDATAVTEFLLAACRRETRLEAHRILSETLPQALKLWPALGAYWRRIIRALSERATTEETQALWAAHSAANRSP